MQTSSYIIQSKSTGKAVFETFNKSTADAVNTDKYVVWSALAWLQSLNAKN